jgi:uncharacterized protein
MDFRTLQYRLAAHLRDPERQEAPEGIEPRRLAVYRELFFNNVSGLLAGAFPVLHAILGEAGWARLVRRFYAEHRAHTPHFPELPGEFLDFIEAERVEEPPFIAELARHEWTELELQIAPDAPEAGVDPSADLLDTVPVLSPLVRARAYTWPVHRLSAGHQPPQPPPQPTFLVGYRGADDGVHFLEVNLPTARLLELIAADEGAKGRELLVRLAGELGACAEALEPALRQQLEDFRRRGILLGGRARG